MKYYAKIVEENKEEKEKKPMEAQKTGKDKETKKKEEKEINMTGQPKASGTPVMKEITRIAGEIREEVNIPQKKELVNNDNQEIIKRHTPLKRVKKTKKRGRPSKLTPEIFGKLITQARRGRTLAETAEEVGIAGKTLEEWHYKNIQGLRDSWAIHKQRGFIEKSERISNEIMDLPTDQIEVDNNGEAIRVVKNPEIVRIKQNESQFNRKAYDKDIQKEEKQEGNVQINIVNYNDKPKEVVSTQDNVKDVQGI